MHSMPLIVKTANYKLAAAVAKQLLKLKLERFPSLQRSQEIVWYDAINVWYDLFLKNYAIRCE